MRRRHLTVLTAVPALALAACGGDGDEGSAAMTSADASDDVATEADEPADESGSLATPAPDVAGAGPTAQLQDTEGEDVGTVMFTDEDGAVRVQADLSGLEPGFHGFHLHQTPECDPDAADGPFTSAEGHWTLGEESHGDHTGDLPSLYAAEDGTASLSFTTDAFTLDDLTSDGGRAVMVHAGFDNFANIPDRYTAEGADAPGPDEDTLGAGDAGDRAACGVLTDDAAGPDTEEDSDS